jgi:TnpA family transposase
MLSHPRRVHADTHGQSAAVFGLAYLLGIELMPRIRRWRKLKLYRPDRNRRYSSIDPLFSGSIKWALIGEHYPLLMQLALAIQSGGLAPSAILAKINSNSTRNRFALALQELGKAVRTRFPLEWIMDDSMRRAVHKCTTKIERRHRFSKFLAFGGECLLRTTIRQTRRKPSSTTNSSQTRSRSRTASIRRREQQGRRALK